MTSDRVRVATFEAECPRSARAQSWSWRMADPSGMSQGSMPRAARAQSRSRRMANPSLSRGGREPSQPANVRSVSVLT